MVITGKNIQVGNRLRVRSWESMANEFGTDSYLWLGEIIQPVAYCYFCDAMKKYCGHVITVSLVFSNGNLGIEEDNGDYFWHPFMLEPLEGTIAYYLEVYDV